MPNPLPAGAKTSVEPVRNPRQVSRRSHRAYLYHLGICRSGAHCSLPPAHPYLRGRPQPLLLALPLTRKVVTHCCCWHLRDLGLSEINPCVRCKELSRWEGHPDAGALGGQGWSLTGLLAQLCSHFATFNRKPPDSASSRNCTAG